MSTPWKTKLETCKSYESECFTLITDNSVRRGCVDDENFNHDECTNRNCLKCSGEAGCNDIDIRNETCIECDSKVDNSCKTNSTFFRNKEVACPLALKKMGCYHFSDQQNGDTRRGCMSSLSESEEVKFMENGIEHKMCFGDNCNSKKWFETCYTCNSTSDPNCITLEQPVESKICNAYDDVCYSHIGINAVTRGCLLETNSQFAEKCRIYSNKCDQCSQTEDKICNRESLTIEHCIACNSDDDENCTDHPTDSSEILCGSVMTSRKEGCYMGTFFNRTRRGCVQDLNYQHKYYICLNGLNDECKTCSGRSCNKKPNFQTCFDCNSRNDPDCADTSLMNQTTLCPNYMDRCFTGIDELGYTIRQCIPETVEGKQLAIKFEECTDNNCNNQLFPVDRLRCHHCNGEDFCDFTPKALGNMTIEPKACSVLAKGDKCYTYMDEGESLSILFLAIENKFFFHSDHKMFRGCLTDPTESRLSCKENDSDCKTCEENSCNNEPIVRPPQFSCMKCFDSDRCTYGQTENNLIKCEMPVLFGREETCFTREVGNGTVERGCTLDLTGGDPDWCQLTDNCNECSESGCNDENVKLDWCIQCDSTRDGEQCMNLIDAEHFIAECETGRSSYNLSRSGCYTINTGKIGNSRKLKFYFEKYFFLIAEESVARGCVKDLDEKELNICENVEWCDVCKDRNCNNEKFSSSSVMKFLASSFLTVLSSVFQWLFKRIKN